MTIMTEWFDVKEHQPTRIGFYNIRWGEVDKYFADMRWWDGSQWLMSEDGMASCFGSPPFSPGEAWRGCVDEQGSSEQ